MRKCLTVLSVIITLSLSSCSDDPRKRYEKAILELTGKEILFPDSMRSIYGNLVPAPDTEYTIVAYFDSIGCTSCRMHLPKWTEFMRKVESIGAKDRVSIFLITETRDSSSIAHFVRKSRFPLNVVSDSLGIFKTRNSIAEDSKLHSFLLDGDHKVIMVGNPTDSETIANLYLDRIRTENDNQDTFLELKVNEFDLGNVSSNKEVSHVFLMTNETSDTLKVRAVTTSCECTSAEISADRIAPNQTYTVKVNFKDSLPGEFTRSVSVYYQDNIPESIFEISGVVRK